jgi:hypothetical protein
MLFVKMKEFLRLKKVQTIATFDGDPEKLDDFLVSVEAFIFAHDLPVKQGGSVAPDDEGGWTYEPSPQSSDETKFVRKNYSDGSKFCALLGQCLTGKARDWWVHSLLEMPNRWRCAPPGCQISGLQEISFIVLLRRQFSDPRSHETALLQLHNLTWNQGKESIVAFRTRADALFARGQISDFYSQRKVIRDAIPMQNASHGYAPLILLADVGKDPGSCKYYRGVHCGFREEDKDFVVSEERYCVIHATRLVISYISLSQ